MAKEKISHDETTEQFIERVKAKRKATTRRRQARAMAEVEMAEQADYLIEQNLANDWLEQ